MKFRSCLTIIMLIVGMTQFSCSKISQPASDEIISSIRIEAEDYDRGGESIGWHDTTSGNAGDIYRNDDVDIEVCFDGGYNVGWITKGEWLKFSNIIASAQDYYVSARVAAKNEGGMFRIEINGKETTEIIRVPATDGFQEWTTIDAGIVRMHDGENTIRIISDADLWNLDWIEFNADKDAAEALKTAKPKPTSKSDTPPKANPRVLLTLSTDAFSKSYEIVGTDDFKKVDVLPDGRPLVLSHQIVADQIAEAGIAIDDSSTTIPYRYRIDGFVERMKNPSPPIDENGMIVVNDGYHDEQMVENILKAYAEKYPDITSLHKFGETCYGRPLWALKISDNANEEEDEPAFLFIAAHHASELLSTEFVLDIIEQLTTKYDTDEQTRQWLDTWEIWCVPLVNPDGLNRFMHQTGSGRKNGRDTNGNGQIDYRDGVDLNRNYPFRWHTLGEKASKSDPNHHWYRGPSAASEPEVQSVMRFSGEQRFVMCISFHTAATKFLVPYTIDEVNNPEPSVAWQIGNSVAPIINSTREDRPYVAARNLYSVDGTDQDWHYFQYGTLAFLLEGPRHNPPYKDRDPIVAGVRPGWAWMLNRLIEGPTLSGHIIDADTGEPIEAVVSLDEVKWNEGEVHTSHPETGRFDRVLPGAGTYHLRVAKNGWQSKVVEVEVGEEWKTIDVRLNKE